jgi:hypothetical protein|tara:strand:+ start:709 stop:852 length:144 start_codon:yes stop_codon:yes gene_type:complete
MIRIVKITEIQEEEDYTDTYPLTVEEYETGDTVAENTEWWRDDVEVE